MQRTDIILRSSDGKMFHSWKALLSISSQFFNDMFALAQPDDAQLHDGLPVIDVAEDSRTLEHVLSLCLPPGCAGSQFKIKSIHELQATLEITAKYNMESAHNLALEELTNPTFLRNDPLRIYALACQFGCHEAARLAAKHTLALPTLAQKYMPELEKIHAGQLHRLLLYREACVATACSLANDHIWIVYPSFWPLFNECKDGDMEWTTAINPPSRKYPLGRVEDILVHRWWSEYMRKAGYALQKTPYSDTVRDKQLLDGVLSAISSEKCKECKGLQVWEAFRTFVDAFAERIDHNVAEIEFSLQV